MAVLEQRRPPDEFIVVDDASTDNSLEVLTQFEGLRGLKVYRNETNVGPTAIIKKWLPRMESDFCALLSANDLIFPEMLDRLATQAEINPDTGFVVSNPVYFKGDPAKATFLTSDAAPRDGYFSKEEFKDAFLANDLKLSTVGAIYNRKAIIEVDGIHENTKWYSDWLNYVVLGFRYGMSVIRENLAAARMTDRSYWKDGISSPENQTVKEALREVMNSNFCDISRCLESSGMAPWM